jgi:hypothetical protein
MILLAGLSGCMSGRSEHGGGAPQSGRGGQPFVPGVQGPWGQPVPMIGPYTSNPPSGAALARQMMAQSMPLDMVHPHPADTGAVRNAGGTLPNGSGLMQASHVAPPGMNQPNMISPPGVPGHPGAPGGLQQAGGFPPGAVAAQGIPPAAAPHAGRFAGGQRSEIRFVNPAGMKVSWYGMRTDGVPGLATSTIDTPGRYNFAQGAIYRLKLSDIPNRPGVELYPTLEVVPSNLRTDSFIAHTAIPVYFTEDDFEQVTNGNYVVKVIYLPYPQYADLAIAGPDEVVSTRLDPGVDPITEAMKRGSIMLVVRMGNIDLEAPNTPAMDAPSPFGAGGACPPMAGLPPLGMMPPVGGNPQVPAVPASAPQGPALPASKPITALPAANPVKPAGFQK